MNGDAGILDIVKDMRESRNFMVQSQVNMAKILNTYKRGIKIITKLMIVTCASCRSSMFIYGQPAEILSSK